MKLALLLFATLILAECGPNPQPVTVAPGSSVPRAQSGVFEASVWYKYVPKEGMTGEEAGAFLPYQFRAANQDFKWLHCQPRDVVVNMNTDQFAALGSAQRHLERLPER